MVVSSCNDGGAVACASCGKEGGRLKKCGACLTAHYCSRECQACHRTLHKADCKLAQAALVDACTKLAPALYEWQLFKQPKRKECPLCLLPLPLDPGDEFYQWTQFMSCCGKVSCHSKEWKRGMLSQHLTKKMTLFFGKTICDGCLVADKLARGIGISCPFCRHPFPKTKEDYQNQLKKRMEAGDAMALYIHGLKTMHKGLPKNAIDLYCQAAALGSMEAHASLGGIFRGGLLPKDEQKSIHHLELAAMGGHILARHGLGVEEMKRGNVTRAMKHWVISAHAGWDKSLAEVKEGYSHGLVTKDEFEKTLRAHQAAKDETKSEQRDRAAAMRPLEPSY